MFGRGQAIELIMIDLKRAEERVEKEGMQIFRKKALKLVVRIR